MANKNLNIGLTVEDHATAKIKELNATLKQLEKDYKVRNADQIVTSKKEELRMRELNKGVSNFGKSSRSELEQVAKSWGTVGGKIGGTIESLGRAAKLGGAAVALGVALKAVDSIANAYLRASDAARNLATNAARIGITGPALQNIQRLGESFYGQTAEQMTASVRHAKDVSFDALHGIGDPQITRFLKLHGITKDDLKDPEKLYMKLLHAAGSPLRTEGEQADPTLHARTLTALLGNDEMIRATEHLDQLDEHWKFVLEHGIGITGDAAKKWDDLNTAIGNSKVITDSLGTALSNAFSGFIPDIVKAIDLANEFENTIAKWVTKYPQQTRDITTGFGDAILHAIPGYGIISDGMKLFNWWKGRSTAPNAAPTSTPSTGTPGPGGSLIDNLAKAIELTESANGYNDKPQPGHSATGPMQMMPDTFNEYAKPGEDISNPDDNRAVARRYIAKLIEKYGSNPDTIAYSYANGSPHSPDRNPGYLQKFHQNFDPLNKQSSLGPAVGAVKDLATAMEAQDPFKQHQELHNYCAHLVNMSLKAVGLPPITDSHGHESDIATDASAYGQAVDPKDIQRGDIGVAMYGHRRGETGGHTMVFTGRTKPDGRGGLLYEIDSSHSRVTGGAGTDWRHLGPDDISVIRRAPQAPPTETAGTKHEVSMNFENVPRGARIRVDRSDGDAALNMRTRYAMQTV